MMEAIGIDLGTTCSVVAHINAAGRAEAVRNREGSVLTPSVVYFGDNPPVVGELAKEYERLGDGEVASFFKRSMGDPTFRPRLGGSERSAEELASFVLRKLKEDAEAALVCPITQAVITVPAYFNNDQRKATISAGERAGLEVLQIINEPTSAAVAYGMHESRNRETLLVYDLGGGTFDVSLVEVSPNELVVRATAGDHNLGGKDWDDRIAMHVAEAFLQARGCSPLDYPEAAAELLSRSEDAKKTLSARETTRITVHFRGHRESVEIARSLFEQLTNDLMERTQALVEKVLDEESVGWDELTGVLLVGGSTRMPVVAEYVKRMSGRPPVAGVNVDEAVALGAAIRAAQCLDDGATSYKQRFFLARARQTKDVMSHSLGMIAVSADGARYVNSIIYPKNRLIPGTATRTYQLAVTSRTSGELEVFMTQGESESPLECLLVGKYRFTEIVSLEGNKVLIEVTYGYDESGVIVVKARVKDSEEWLPMSVERVTGDMSWLTQPPQKSGDGEKLTAYLAIDVSGSMAGQPLTEAKNAAREFVRQLNVRNAAIGLISFADQIRMNARATNDAKTIEAAIAAMQVGLGGGNSATPFAYVHNLLQDVAGSQVIVVLTDGVWYCQQQAIEEAESCRRDGIEIIAVGFGAADQEFLRRLTSSEEATFLTQMNQLTDTFGTIARELAARESNHGLRLP